MSKFINIEDYDSTTRREIIEALTRSDDITLDTIENQCIAMVRSYLNNRYDCDAVFSRRGDERNDLILKITLNLCVYEVFSINPQKLSQTIRDKHEQAIKWLEAVNNSKLSIDGAPLLPKEERLAKSTFLIKSNPKRVNHY